MSLAREFVTLIPVAVVSGNPLASRYIQSVLERSSDLHFQVVGDNEMGSHGVVTIGIIEDSSIETLSPRLKAVQSRFPQVRGLAVTSSAPPEVICRWLRDGFRGFLSYSDLEGNLGSAIRLVAEGHVWAPAETLDLCTRNALSAALDGKDSQGLTPREQAVARLLERRLSNKVIAFELGISERTVKFHVSNIFDKLGVHERFSIYEAALAKGKAG